MAEKMDQFRAGINNFWVGLVCGMLMPVAIVVVLLYVTVNKLSHFTQETAIAPLFERGEQTLDKVDNLLLTLDSKVDNASLEELQLLAPLKNAQLFPELKTLAAHIGALKQTGADADKKAVMDNLQSQLQQSLAAKFPPEKAQELAHSLINIATVLTSQSLSDEQGNVDPIKNTVKQKQAQLSPPAS